MVVQFELDTKFLACLRRAQKSEMKVCRVVTCLKLYLSVYLSFSNVINDRVACVCVDMRYLAI